MGEDTRKLLRVFGVTVTRFEEESEALVERVRAAGPGDPDFVSALRELFELLGESHESWRAVTERILDVQGRRLREIGDALGRTDADG